MDDSSLLEVETKISLAVLNNINTFATPERSDVGILDAWSSQLLYHCDTCGTPAVVEFFYQHLNLLTVIL